MAYGSYIQIKKLEDELVCCQNENIRLQMIIDLQNLQKEFKDEIFGPRKTYGRFVAQIEELKCLNKKSQNHGIKKEVDDNKANCR